jgi:protein ImuB
MPPERSRALALPLPVDTPRAPRVLALSLPDLSLQRALRSRPGAPPLAVVHEGRVAACSPSARASGVRPGDSQTQARAACAGLVAVPLDPAADRAALRALAEALLAIAPAVEIAPPDVLLLDASAAHLARPPGAEPEDGGEAALAGRALALAAGMGYRGRAAVASGKGPARALARHGGEPLLRAAPGETARALAPLPLSALDLSPGMEDRLAAVGVGGVGALARLPPEGLVHRFGPEGAAAARLARGEDERPLVPYVPETLPEEAWDCDGAVESAEPLLFGAKRLADRVAARLAGRGLGATRLKLTLKLDPRGEERLLLQLARPTAVAAIWLALLRERLSALRLPAAVTGLRLSTVEVAEAPPEQLSIGDRPEAARALEAVLSRLAARLGEGALFAAAPADRHRPEAAYRAGPFLKARAAPASRRQRRNGAGTPAATSPAVAILPQAVRPTRLLSPPRLVVAEGEGGRLTALRLGGRAWPVAAMAGPERLAGEWWSEPFDRDYYRIRLEGLGDCWIYRDGADGRLYLHGLFD